MTRTALLLLTASALFAAAQPNWLAGHPVHAFMVVAALLVLRVRETVAPEVAAATR